MITDFEKIDNVASQDALDAMVKRIAVESTSAYRKLNFSTVLMPNHESGETLYLDIPELFNPGLKVSETGWEMDLRIGGLMRHNTRVVVNL